jgi:hypothetical protein
LASFFDFSKISFGVGKPTASPPFQEIHHLSQYYLTLLSAKNLERLPTARLSSLFSHRGTAIATFMASGQIYYSVLFKAGFDVDGDTFFRINCHRIGGRSSLWFLAPAFLGVLAPERNLSEVETWPCPELPQPITQRQHPTWGGLKALLILRKRASVFVEVIQKVKM